MRNVKEVLKTCLLVKKSSIRDCLLSVAGTSLSEASHNFTITQQKIQLSKMTLILEQNISHSLSLVRFYRHQKYWVAESKYKYPFYSDDISDVTYCY